MLQYDFIAEGFIPEFNNLPNFAEILVHNRECLFQKKFIDAFRFKYNNIHGQFTPKGERAFLMEVIHNLVNTNDILMNDRNKLLSAYMEYCQKVGYFIKKPNC